MTAHCFSIIGFLCGCRLFFSLSHCTDCLYTMNRISGFLCASSVLEWLSHCMKPVCTPMGWVYSIEVVAELASVFSSVAQLYLTLCDSMDCSMPGLPECTQTHVHWVSDAIQPFHPLSSPSPPTFNLSQNQGLFQWVSSLHQATKVLEFQLQHQSFQWIFRTYFL